MTRSRRKGPPRITSTIRKLRAYGVPIDHDGRLRAPWRDGKAGERISPRIQKALVRALDEERTRAFLGKAIPSKEVPN